MIKISPLLPGVALESLAPFDTILVRTLNSDYRIFYVSNAVTLKTGTYLAQLQPSELLVIGELLTRGSWKLQTSDLTKESER